MGPDQTPLDIESSIQATQVEMTFDRSRSSNLAGPPAALAMVWILWPEVPHGLLLGWLALKLGVTVLWVLATQRFDRVRTDQTRVLFWGRVFDLLLVADGLVFSLLGTVLMPPNNPVLAMVMVATLLGIAAIGLVVLSTNQRSNLALVTAILVPPMLWQLLQMSSLGLYVGAGMALFLVLVLVEGRRAAEHTRAALRLRLQMVDLAAQRQQALDQAQQSSQVKSQFLATMSHEVRTPLHGILGLTRLLRSESADGAAQAGETRQAERVERLRTLERTGEHLLNILNDVLDYSKIESRHLQLQLQRVDLHCDSAPEGGTCFRLVLPLRAAGEPSSVERPTRP